MDTIEELSIWNRGFCHANGIEISYLRSGGQKPSVIALHGLIGSGACLLPLARSLASFDVILPDARGHGRSSTPNTGYKYADLAQDAVGLIAALDLTSPVLVGHSMGGLTAAVVASERGASVTAMVLIDPTFISPQLQKEVHESNVGAEHKRLLKSSKADLLAQAQQRSPNRSAEMVQYLVDARLQTSINAFEVLTPPNPEWRSLVSAIKAPTLLMTAERGIVSLETARELQRLNPLIQHQHVASAGHGMPYDEPERIGSMLALFLSQVAAIGLGAERDE